MRMERLTSVSLRTIVCVVTVLFPISCAYDYSNPSDPRSDDYQDYDVVLSVDDVEPVPLSEAEYLFIPLLTVTESLNASGYWIQMAEYEEGFENDDLVYERTECDSNAMIDVSDADLVSGRYYWRVCARDATSWLWGEWSGLSTFVTIAPEIIAESPQDTHDTTPLLDWDEYVDAAGYELQFGSADLAGTERASVTDSSYTIPVESAFEYDAVFHWRVRVILVDGTRSVWSETFEATVTAEDPGWSGIAPMDGGETPDTTPLLEWSDVSWAAEYEVAFSTTYTDVEGILQNGIRAASASEYQVSGEDAFPKGGTVSWMIRAVNEDGIAGAWSSVLSFGVSYEVGDTGPGGGVVFHDKGSYSDNWRYLEAAPSDQSTGIVWGGYGTELGVGETGVGTGKSNTDTILAALGTGTGTAAGLCHSLVLGSCTDWFLPSLGELTLMYQQKSLLGDFEGIWYWSSSELDYSADWYARELRIDTGDITGLRKDSTAYVRAIRSF